MRSVTPSTSRPSARRSLRLAAGSGAVTTALFTALTLVPPGADWLASSFLPSPVAAGVLVPLVAMPTAVRVLAHSGPATMPPHTVDAILTGLKLTLYLLAAGLVLVAAELLAGSLDPVTGPAPVLLPVAWLCAGVGLLVSALFLHAARAGLPAVARPVADRARPDLFDDAATLAARALPGSSTARGAVWLNRGLDGWAWSPRRHRTGFVLAAAGVTAVLAVVGREFAIGPWSDPVAPAVLAVCTAAVVGGVLAAGIAWLGLLRPQPK